MKGQTQYDGRINEMRANLHHVWVQRTAADQANGQDWYEHAHKIMVEWADHYRVPIATVASVTAALSPQCRWERNLICAANVLDGRPMSLGEGALQANYLKAERILEDRATSIMPYFKSAPKVASFQQNLQGNLDYVTVDTHAAQAALNNPTAKVSLKWNPYLVFASAYALNAQELGIAPATYQAIIWCTWKTLYPPQDKRSLIRKGKGE